MSIGPILPGRLPNSFAAGRLTQQIQTAQIDLQRLQDQVTTGQRYQVGSENPASALRTIVLQRRLEQQQQFKSNVQTNRTQLAITEDSLTTVSTGLNQMKSLILQGLNGTQDERRALATEADALLTHVVSVANSSSGGRYLFAGSQSAGPPFEIVNANQVRYSGDQQELLTFANTNLSVVGNIDGVTTFNAIATVQGQDLNVALTPDTRLSDLQGGIGIKPGSVKVTLQDGTDTVTRTVDLSTAQTIGDLKTQLEAAFSGTAVELTVDVDPASKSGLRLTPASGTITVSDLSGSRTASDLGIKGTSAAVINGGDLDPRLTLTSRVSDLNGGTGIGATADTGLQITNGGQTKTVDLSSAVTVEDMLNELKLAGLDLAVGLNQSGNGIAVSSRLSGTTFSIGENGGTEATQLGIRTLRGTTRLSELNLGSGPGDTSEPLSIVRRDGTTASVDLSSASTIQDVLNAINAVDPGVLVASFRDVGNGISITDSSGTGPLTVTSSTLSTSLGIAGTEPGSDPLVALNGEDVNPLETRSIFTMLSRLRSALESGDVQELNRINELFDVESKRFVEVRGQIGTRTRLLDDLENQLLDEEVSVNESLAKEFGADLTEVLTALLNRQQSLQATFEIAGRAFDLNLLSFL